MATVLSKYDLWENSSWMDLGIKEMSFLIYLLSRKQAHHHPPYLILDDPLH